MIADTLDHDVDPNAGIDGQQQDAARAERLEEERLEYVNATYTPCCD